MGRFREANEGYRRVSAIDERSELRAEILVINFLKELWTRAGDIMFRISGVCRALAH